MHYEEIINDFKIDTVMMSVGQFLEVKITGAGARHKTFMWGFLSVSTAWYSLQLAKISL